ncbi:MAG: hypothetical protein MUF15_19700, partial [Acidobacteria bacterium]|nr:hypothetical protein [Acidobacteriota bacterium]
MNKKNFFGKKKEVLPLYVGMSFIFIFLCTYYLFPRYNFEKISIAEGLSQNSIFAILQDSRGFLWFGTEDGLNRYDGYTFKVYKHNPDDPHSLSSNWIRSIYEDHSGTIWIGTQGGGLNKFDRYKETFTRYTQNPSNSKSLSDNTIWTIREEKPGVLLLGTNRGLNQFFTGTGEVIHWFLEPVDKKSAYDVTVKTIVVEKPGLSWIGTLGNGLYQWVEGKMIHYINDPANPHSLNSNKVQAIFIRGAIYVNEKTGQKIVFLGDLHMTMSLLGLYAENKRSFFDLGRAKFFIGNKWQRNELIERMKKM